jgi:hypothetical protein
VKGGWMNLPHHTKRKIESTVIGFGLISVLVGLLSLVLLLVG